MQLQGPSGDGWLYPMGWLLEPSLLPEPGNAYMPAQTEEGQIPVPIFRMLGSDPIYQYDDGLGQERQG